MDTLLSYLLRFAVGGGVYVNASMSANYTVSTVIGSMSPHFYVLAPAGADREFILPPPARTLIGTPFLVSNSAAGGGYSVLVRGKTLTYTGTLSSASTIGTIPPGVTAYAICYDDGTYFRWKYQALSSADALTLTGMLTAAGIVNAATVSTGTAFANTAAITSSGNAATITANPSSATANAKGLVVAVNQTTNNRTAGTVPGVDITITGRAGDTSGGTYPAIQVTPVASGGSAIFSFAKIAAGLSHLFDLSALATGQADDVLGDNLANARGWRVGASTYFLKVITTTGAQLLEFAKPIKLTGGLSASGSSFSSTEQTATGSPQNIAHGLGRTPTVVWAYVTDSGATGIYTLVPATHDGTNIVFNGTAGIKYRAFAL